MALYNLKKAELITAVQDLTEVKEHLKKCLKLQGDQLVRALQDVPYDKMVMYDKNLAYFLRDMHKHVYDGNGLGNDCSILADMKDALKKTDKKIEYVIGRLDKYKKKTVR